MELSFGPIYNCCAWFLHMKPVLPAHTSGPMTHYSDKQVLLNGIVHALELSIPAEIKQNADRVQHSCSTDIDDLDNDGDRFPLSQHLVRLYTFICKHRYTISHYNPLGHADKLIHLLDRYASINHRMYCGLVCMSPEAFNNLAI